MNKKIFKDVYFFIIELKKYIFALNHLFNMIVVSRIKLENYIFLLFNMKIYGSRFTMLCMFTLTKKV